MSGWKVALTARADAIDTVQAPVPAQAPAQPTNREPLCEAAVRVTDVLLGKLAEQLLPQLIPAGLDVTTPDPSPPGVTVSSLWSATRPKAASALVAA